MPRRPKGPQADCPECGKTFNANYLRAHRRRIHGTYLANRSTKRKGPHAEVELYVQRNDVPQLNLTLSEVRLYEDAEGHVFLVERLR